MKKLIITSIVALAISPVFASDYLPQEVTSEVYTTEQVTATEETYQAKQEIKKDNKNINEKKSFNTELQNPLPLAPPYRAGSE